MFDIVPQKKWISVALRGLPSSSNPLCFSFYVFRRQNRVNTEFALLCTYKFKFRNSRRVNNFWCLFSFVFRRAILFRHGFVWEAFESGEPLKLSAFVSAGIPGFLQFSAVFCVVFLDSQFFLCHIYIVIFNAANKKNRNIPSLH